MISYPLQLGESSRATSVGIGVEEDIDDPMKDDIQQSGNKFCVDYSKRGTAKCKICKKLIPKDDLRIGGYAFFKGTCFFQKMKRARVEANVIQSPNDIDGFEKIMISDQEAVSSRIEEDKSERTTPFPTTYGKKQAAKKIKPGARRKKLKMVKTPSIKIMFTNADQFTHAKKDELQQRIITKKTYADSC